MLIQITARYALTCGCTRKHIRASAAHKLWIWSKVSISVHTNTHTHVVQFAIPLTCFSFHNAIATACHKVKVYIQYYVHKFPCILACINCEVLICQNLNVWQWQWQQWKFNACNYTLAKWQYHFPTHTHAEWRLWCGSNRPSTSTTILACVAFTDNFAIQKPFLFS